MGEGREGKGREGKGREGREGGGAVRDLARRLVTGRVLLLSIIFFFILS